MIVISHDCGFCVHEKECPYKREYKKMYNKLYDEFQDNPHYTRTNISCDITMLCNAFESIL